MGTTVKVPNAKRSLAMINMQKQTPVASYIQTSDMSYAS